VTVVLHATGSGQEDVLWFALAVPLVVLSAALLAWSRRRGSKTAMLDAATAVAGIAVLLAVTSPPFDAVADQSFSVHMLQHMAVVLLAAPLLAAAALRPSLAAAVPREFRPKTRGLMRLWYAAISSPAGSVAATAVFTVVFWTWHLPVFFDAALDHVLLHAFEHATFLVMAFVFWSAVLTRRAVPAVTVSVLFITMMQMGLLGALLTLSRRVWYSHYALESALGLGPLEDQQLGGLIMWVPANVLFLFALAVVVYRWIRADEERGRRDRATSLPLTHSPP
jgi:putative membrane protein